MAWSTPRTWVAGELVSASIMNAHIRDNLNAIVPVGPDAWTSYTPTLTQGVTVTKTVTYAKYMKVGRMVTVVMRLDCTSTGTAANGVVVSLPLTAASGTTMALGSGVIIDASASVAYCFVVVTASTSTVSGYATTNTAATFVGQSGFTAALATSDVVTLNFTYEAAS